MEMRKIGRRLSAALLGLLAVLCAIAAHAVFVLVSVPPAETLFREVLEDPAVQEQLGRVLVPDGHKASFKEADLRACFLKDFHAAWLTWLEGQGQIGSLAIGFRECRDMLASRRPPWASVPETFSFIRLVGLTVRDQALLTTARLWYRRLGDAAWIAALLALILFSGGFCLAPDRIRYLVLPAFLFTVISLTIALFILLFRQQVLGLAQAALEQVSRNTPVERALVREGLGLVMDRVLWLHLPGALVSGTALLLLQFRRRDPAPSA